MSYIDIVVSGPDMSGTSTQIKDIIEFFQIKGLKVKDIRGTEIDALFHAELFEKYNSNYLNLTQFLKDDSVPEEYKQDFREKAIDLLEGCGGTNKDLKVASFVRNNISTYIDPDSADVWIMEEPTKRGAGQTNRVVEQNRTQFGGELDPVAAAYCHQTYRVSEFLRFRKILREKNKVIVRSRSEESACYQIYDENYLNNGIDRDTYIDLPGHKIAFGHPPTHLFFACAPEDWTVEQYITLKKERSDGRLNDDHEFNVHYQLLVNKRYASNWIDDLYKDACTKYCSKTPEMIKFSLYDSKEQIRDFLYQKLETIVKPQSSASETSAE